MGERSSRSSCGSSPYTFATSFMKPAERLLARVQQTLDDLESARATLESGAIEERYRCRIGADFWQDLDDQGTRLRESIDDLNQAAVNDFQQGPQLATFWGEFDINRRKSEDLVAKCLALTEGAIARSKEIDGGMCDIADVLLDELERSADLGWKRFTLPAVGESFSNLEQIIRIRFPSRDIWSLPVAAHEFGHFAARKMTDRA